MRKLFYIINRNNNNIYLEIYQSWYLYIYIYMKEKFFKQLENIFINLG